VQSLPACRPAGFEGWLRARGLVAFDVQDRVVRGAARPRSRRPRRPDAGSRWSGSTPRAEAWSDFLHRYIAREHGRIVAARGMFIGRDGLTWLGMDAPVPGIRTADHLPDEAICAAIVAGGLARGARGFLADIEAPSPALDTPPPARSPGSGSGGPTRARTGRRRVSPPPSPPRSSGRSRRP
jgi:hypothetical protein